MSNGLKSSCSSGHPTLEHVMLLSTTWKSRHTSNPVHTDFTLSNCMDLDTKMSKINKAHAWL